MNHNKYRIIITYFEYRLLVKVLAEFRNQLLEDSKPTDDVNERLLKIIDTAKPRWWR